MDRHTDSNAWRESLRLARDGEQESLGGILDEAREYLLQIARRLVAHDVQSKLSGSDVVQESLCEAQRDFAQFRGQTWPELLGWLRGILLHNLLNQHRRLRGTRMRDVGREVLLGDLAAHGDELVDNASTPSDVLMRQEAAAVLREALDRLPADYREVILLRHQEELPFAEIGLRLDRSADAARMLWSRAFDRLMTELGAPSGSST